MKTILRTSTLLFICAFLSAITYAQNEPKVAVVKFETSALCGMCKDRIEEKLNYTKGIIWSELDLKTKILTVKYRTATFDEVKIKKLVSKIGYRAGEVERDTTAFKALPKCCREAGFCED